MEEVACYLDREQSVELLRDLAAHTGATEFARVRNLDYVFSPFEIYPLAPHVRPPLPTVAAVAVDMDGTSTTTEPLALHALEYMVRRMTGRLTPDQWGGLDPERDYPFVIGSSNFRHVEFLVSRYGDRIDRDALRQAFFEALGWTLSCMDDPQRRRDVALTARNCGLNDLLEDNAFGRLVSVGDMDARSAGRCVAPLIQRFGPAFRCDGPNELVSAALDVYYMRYHSILREIEQGRGTALSRELLGASGRRLVEPMPGYDIFLPLVKGWLGREVAPLYERLRDALPTGPEAGFAAEDTPHRRDRLVRLAERFEGQPARLALVTASIAYEAHATMKEVVRVVAEQVQDWPVPAACRDNIAARLADYRAVFDGFVCATDACEPRLKPHRDLYSLALYQMAVPREQYSQCVGLEDTEPGIIAVRAAGIGCAVALPNRDTSRQNYAAATEIVHGGLPELILLRNLMLTDRPE